MQSEGFEVWPGICTGEHRRSSANPSRGCSEMVRCRLSRGRQLDEDIGDKANKCNWNNNEKHGNTNVITRHSRKGCSSLGNRRGNPMWM